MSFQTDFAMVFVQKLSELDDASQSSKKWDTTNYESDDYVKLILTGVKEGFEMKSKPKKMRGGGAAEVCSYRMRKGGEITDAAKRWRWVCARRRGQENDAWR